ncbi:A nuclease family of the HNH/ENDO VII superfamily with conserved AHH [Stigmatella aurantiaca]|uniref:A nuclease family of the HNH/ENDO VII superfamily with conserved AHH n=1 Tax=Stigmatella aurantiaca TaxID=41 RepID=A0A1H7HZT1_STIAU|nr:AHH domain-containing protein [Stigmatella aurantiaca]SEK53745.1 A nuclease family of the HNH/ENDO VII superfamily with conserved AHH [Stigmatella aurantiaca]
MSKPKKSDNFTKQPLGSGASDIFNPDLSAKPTFFPELDDKDYPAELLEELKKDKQQQDKEAEDACPPEPKRPIRLRGFHKYRTAAYIHDQGKLGKNGRDYYTKRPDYGKETLDAALASGLISQRTYDILSDDKKWKDAMAFPREGSPSKYSKYSKRFLLSNINRHKADEDNFYLTGSWYPYQWTAHHLIPHEALSGKNLSSDEYDLLVESGYDVNNGHNGIIAPACSWAVPMHQIIQHKGSHDMYTEFVERLIASVKGSLKTLADQTQQQTPPKDHKTVLADVLDELTKKEQVLWNRLLKISATVVPEVMRGSQAARTFVVSFKRNKGKSLYPFGVLI